MRPMLNRTSQRIKALPGWVKAILLVQGLGPMAGQLLMDAHFLAEQSANGPIKAAIDMADLQREPLQPAFLAWARATAQAMSSLVGVETCLYAAMSCSTVVFTLITVLSLAEGLGRRNSHTPPANA